MPSARVDREPAAFERDLLRRLSDRWGQRVAVKKDELDLDGHFDAALPDFPDHLVPVLRLPEARRLDPEARDRILSASWIAYNAKTTAIETEVILPACRLMLEERIPVRHDHTAVAALHQTIIDEHYHILMCHNAVGVTRRRRGLGDLGFGLRDWSVVRRLDARRAETGGRDRDLIEIGFALAAETTINAFLSGLSTAEGIQPMNRLTVDLHRRDESGHAVIFRELAVSLYHALDPAGRELFRRSLAEGLAAFGAADTDPWVAVAAAGGLDVDPERLGGGLPGTPSAQRDTGPLQTLLDELRIAPEEITGGAGRPETSTGKRDTSW